MYHKRYKLYAHNDLNKSDFIIVFVTVLLFENRELKSTIKPFVDA